MESKKVIDAKLLRLNTEAQWNTLERFQILNQAIMLELDSMNLTGKTLESLELFNISLVQINMVYS